MILGSDVHPVRQAVPHLPTAREPGRGTSTSSAGAEGEPGRCRRCGERVRLALCRSRTSRRSSRRSASTTAAGDRTSDMAANWQDTCPRCRRAPVALAQIGTGRRVRLMARSPAQRGGARSSASARTSTRPRPAAGTPGLEIDRESSTPTAASAASSAASSSRSPTTRSSGFEPRYDFPFNEGKLCPKGVKRYLQGSHPDRLLTRSSATPSAPGGFRRVSWEHALDRTVARDPPHPGRRTATTRSPCCPACRSPTRSPT